MKLIQTIHSYDVVLFHWLVSRKHRELCTGISRWISRSGDGFLYPLVAVLLFALDPSEGRAFFICAAGGFLIERPLYFVLKNVLKRGRPEQALPDFRSFIVPSDRFSFPSGHTSAAFLMAVLLSYFFPLLTAPLFAWAAAVGLSRIFLGVHFPTDVLVGSMMGSVIALISIKVLAA